MIERIISGYQTGADQGALAAAQDNGVQIGGAAPHGGVDENGLIPERFAGCFEAMAAADDSVSIWDMRTAKNLETGDAVIIFVPKLPLPVMDGTKLTMDRAASLRKPCLIIDLSKPIDADAVEVWVCEHSIKTLNVAGPRESSSPGMYQAVYEVVSSLCKLLIAKKLMRKADDPAAVVAADATSSR
eukprot:TRINITY_DN110692_c0_g1_i1.p1 TRINITY_DN110692_c0_g1~~TRINITY_DN110692_c0_g1_i1.p1  ORF type:complete len:186 (+),score=34.41 TRINITY_DN110692_c0_g1_i1:178-735(+)